MKRAILPMVVILLLMSLTVQTQTVVPSVVTISFTPALEYTDGVPFTESEIEHYDVYCDGAFLKQVPNDFTRSFMVSVDEVGVGDHTCGLSETVGGMESVMSDTKTFPLGQRTPGAPVLADPVPGA
jgi:hypothetical protein